MRAHSLFSMLAVVVAGAHSVLDAAPCASFMRTDLDHPPVQEGDVGEITFVAEVMNDGDEELIIESIRLGCGCTRVEYDTVVRPRATATIRAIVDIARKEGPLETFVTVQTNEPGHPRIRIGLHSYIHPHIAVGTKRQPGASGVTLVLKTRKPNLKLHSISFAPRGGEESTAVKDFAVSLPTKSGDGKHYLYHVTFGTPLPDSTEGAMFTFKTNHQQKPVLKWRM